MTNFDAEMVQIMNITPVGTPLFLHVCCGPCAATALSRLAGHFDVTLFYYNPNTAPLAEYQKRLATLKALLDQMPLPRPVALVEGPYEAERFAAVAQGLEDEPEGGRRCTACFDLRLGETARRAKARGFGWFGTTLSTGPRKNAALLNQGGIRLAEAEGLRFLPADFKKRDGVGLSNRLCAEYGLYRQHYCGCVYSLPAE